MRKKSQLLTISFLLLCWFIQADYAQQKPQFSDYPAKSTFKGRPARVNLSSTPGARYYRTVIREGAKKGPNFAGNFTIVMWGCGSPCIQVAVVDARSGRVWFTDGATFDVQFRLNSRLMIIDSKEVLRKEFPDTGVPKWFAEPLEEKFFVWNGNRFIRIRPKVNGHPKSRSGSKVTS